MQTSSQAQGSVASYIASSEAIPLGNDAPHRAAPKPGQQADPNACRFVGAPTHAHRNSTRGSMPRSQQLCDLDGSVASMRAGRNEGFDASANDWNTVNLSAKDNVSSNKKGEVSNYCITQQVKGSALARLTFETATEFSAVAPIKNASSCNLIGESNHDHCTANAAVAGSGNVHMAPRLPRSIDEGPWMAFLPGQAHSYSLSVADDLSDQRAPHPVSEFASWSQRATQGTRTPGNASLCVSPSLPWITRKGDSDERRERVHMGTGKSGCPKKQRDENDQLWQSLVFGSGKPDSTDGDAETATRPNKVGMDERRTLPSVGVSRRSTTPFDPVRGPGFCVSDRKQAAATRAPLVTYSGSKLPTITPSTGRFSCGQAGGLSKESGDAARNEDSDFGVQSMTHTSMRTNVSCVCDANCSNCVVGDSARATRIDVDREQGCQMDGVGPTPKSKMEVQHTCGISAEVNRLDGWDHLGGRKARVA